jgi:hypothetical protein
MSISFTYGREQRFRARTGDLNFLGRLHGATPVRSAVWRVNGGEPRLLYIESTPDISLLPTAGGFVATPIDWRYQYKLSPAALRLWQLGDFNVELPIGDHDLRPGENELVVEIVDRWKERHVGAVMFSWDPVPPSLPLDLTDLSGFETIQDVGQVVDGAFDLDCERSVIRSTTPVAPDNLFAVGPTVGNQEATFRIRFHDVAAGKYLGVSDFFVAHEDAAVPFGIKPGWSTAGMATVKSNGECRTWIAWGDNSDDPKVWIVFTDPAAYFRPLAEVDYRVRHQVLFADGVTSTRFRVWREDEDEPTEWLCSESDRDVDPALPRHTGASFSLFQHTGVGSEWSDLRVAPIGSASERLDRTRP